jgi:hypothetical protein
MIPQCAAVYPDGSGIPTFCFDVIDSCQPSEARGFGLMICLSLGE